MAAQLTFLRSSALEQLRIAVDQDVSRYDCAGDFADLFGGERYSRRAPIEIGGDWSTLLQLPEGGDNKDAQNSLAVYRRLAMLTPENAGDERIWAYLCHFDLQTYVKHRWLVPNRATAKSIQAHYFAPTARSLIRDNGVSRLWWMGYVASKVASLVSREPEYVLEVLLHRSDVRANLLERPTSATNLNILAAVLVLLIESYEGDQKSFERRAFRHLMRSINAMGGVLVLDVLPVEELMDHLVSLVEAGT